MNRLAGESSAYLRQHAQNPVHWWPFTDGAFLEAGRRDVPVFLSVGYAACHWCHVMAGESFEDADTADYLNKHFVSIKVDREERPDVDAAYMSATQAMTGEGGWPMSVFLTTDGRAFFAGTYFPPSPMPGRASFRQVLEAVCDAWTQRRGQVEASAGQLADQLSKTQSANRKLIGSLAVQTPASEGDHSVLFDAALQVLAEQEDAEFGGFGGAPKFPPSPVLDWLIRHAVPDLNGRGSPADPAAGPGAGSGGTGPDLAAKMASRTLEAMATSALFDQLEGGFARYTVDRAWAVPHFEKMLYDNAQLMRIYTRWSRLEGATNPDHNPASPARAVFAGRIASETADWLLAGLALEPSGAFASSLDADTVLDGVHEEGGTYLWSHAELESVLGTDDAAMVAGLMGIGADGTVSAKGSALRPGRLLTTVEQQAWDWARPQLREVRRRRPQPARDDKVVAGWNGLAVAGLAEAGMILDRPDFVAAAERTGRYLSDVHLHDGRLKRVSHDGRAQGINGLLEDYAFCAEGFFALFAATGDARWYRSAEQLIAAAERLFVVDGQLRDSAGESSQLWNAQGRSDAVDPLDSPTPSGAAGFAQALITYAAYSGSHRHRRLADGILGYARQLAARAPRAVGGGLSALEAMDAGPVQAAVVGPGGPTRAAMIRAVWASPSPGLVLAASADQEPESGFAGAGQTRGVAAGQARDVSASESVITIPLLRGRTAGTAGEPRAYLCRNMVCGIPADSLEKLLEQLGQQG